MMRRKPGAYLDGRGGSGTGVGPVGPVGVMVVVMMMMGRPVAGRKILRTGQTLAKVFEPARRKFTSAGRAETAKICAATKAMAARENCIVK